MRNRNNSPVQYVFTACICCTLLLLCAIQSAAHAVSMTKGLQQHMRIPKIADFQKVNGTDAVQLAQKLRTRTLQHQQQLPQQQQDYNASKLVAGIYDIRSVSGEPGYKSVNLTWEVEFLPNILSSNNSANIITNNSNAVEPPKAFQIFFCEMQTFGPHRCRSKVVDSNSSAEPMVGKENGNNRQLRYYATQIDNLRMATTYSFHIREQPPQHKHRSMRHGGRHPMYFEGNALDNDAAGSRESQSELDGETIIIPTKGFSAEATKCLPHASEIEVETGPYFGGKIVVDGGNCGVKGKPNDAADKYIMRIDHKTCGSLIKPETNTVETFITVQENLGIYTHSTRRFVVVCSFQSGMQTVRASFTVPGKGGVAALVENDPFIPDDRSGRELSGMQYVDKSALVLKENLDGREVDTSSSELSTNTSEEAIVSELFPLMSEETPNTINESTTNSILSPENIKPIVSSDWHIKHENYVIKQDDEAKRKNVQEPQANYAKLVVDRSSYENDNTWHYKEHIHDVEDKVYHLSTLHYITAHMGNVLLAAIASVIFFVVFIALVIREVRRQRNCQRQQQLQEERKYDM